MRLALTALALATLTTAAAADVEVSFREGAPKDRFTITNVAECPLTDAALTLDLSASTGALVFDVTGEGAGVDVFQPFEIVEGAEALAALPRVQDGDRSVTLSIATLAAGQAIAFTIDVDDTKRAREITVTDNELSGATVQLAAGSGTETAVFGDRPATRVATPACGG